MNSELKTYLVTYMNGKTQTVKGRVYLYSSGTTVEVPRVDGVNYLNANAVLSVIEQTEKEAN